MSKKVKICHITSAHDRYDDRIFLKECLSLNSNPNFEVSQVVADGLGDEVKDGIQIYDAGPKASRLKRMIFTTRKVYKKTVELNCDIYHFHDPELFFIGKKLIKKGAKVIFDAHEDLPKQLLSKPYLNDFFAKLLSRWIAKYELRKTKKLSGVVGATEMIADKYSVTGTPSIAIKNYPKLSEFESIELNSENRQGICYVGGITRIRGIEAMIDALEFFPIQFHLAGKFQDEALEEEMKNAKGWSDVKYYGFVNRQQIQEIFSKSSIGLSTLLPTPAYVESLPIKIFEYMAYGLPFIYSNFDYWIEMFEGKKYGIPVNPENPKEIADAIEYLTNNKELAKEMGNNGRLAVEEIFNWENEAKKLEKFYTQILEIND